MNWLLSDFPPYFSGSVYLCIFSHSAQARPRDVKKAGFGEEKPQALNLAPPLCQSLCLVPTIHHLSSILATPLSIDEEIKAQSLGALSVHQALF